MDKVTAQSKHEQNFQLCFYCNGYFGPCFGEPVCINCHKFLFSDDWHLEQFEKLNKNEYSFESPCYMGSIKVNEEQIPASSSFDQFSEKLRPPRNSKLDDGHDLVFFQEPVNKIPPEIWMSIFQTLDHVSLLMASKVNRMWKSVALDHLPIQNWKHFVEQRWPLFRPKYNVHDWHSLCSDLLDSTTCKRCFIHLNWNPQGTSGPDRSLRSVRLASEIQCLSKDPPFGIKAISIDRLNFNWVARIKGPQHSAYDGGVFYLQLKVPINYPIMPPIVRFNTKIFHPNISRHGDIGMDITGHKWTIATTIVQVLLSVQNLLDNPFPEINMEPEIAALYKMDKAAFYQTASEWTRKYAMHEMHPQ